MTDVQQDATCEAQVPDSDDDYGECGELSRFVVERSDRDPSYGSAEACEDHLAQIVALLIDGAEDVQAIVTIRWGYLDTTESIGGVSAYV